jgi:hypothetical protein
MKDGVIYMKLVEPREESRGIAPSASRFRICFAGYPAIQLNATQAFSLRRRLVSPILQQEAKIVKRIE